VQNEPEKSYLYLKEKLREIKVALEEARKNEFASVLTAVRCTVAEYGITERDIFGGRRDGRRDHRYGPVSAKYRNPDTGETWTGRGRPPRWISGKHYDPFLIKAGA
jgi:DNA-binding protein H-NS